MALFDRYQNAMLTTVRTLYGDDATWLPSAGGAAVTGKVLFNTPTEAEQTAIGDYTRVDFAMEYHEGQLPGLFESVRSGGRERVTIKGQTFMVQAITLHHDGKTFNAHLQLLL